jgi:hypothetical protein
MRVRDNVLYPVLKRAFRLGINWRGINATPSSLCSWEDTASWLANSN